ncbi:cellulase family glycosylhydrolase [Desertivirga arenae]|uniref:cellulase family glycosylhydrolase n=1 Tax=Desertivirga arenae TaxID=2810309 RepID=UPI001F61001D|nr:cellulase family glycosylhydrolase [Pedobacter sp. SYSU D00823]
MKRKNLLLSSVLTGAVLLINTIMPVSTKAQGFLRAEGKQIVNEKGENILLRGMGLGGWMLQEGYMLGLNADGQQYKIRERIEALIGKKQTEEFYEIWLANHTTRADIDSLKAWGFNSIRLPMHYNLYTLSVEEEPVAGKNTWLPKGFALTDSLLAWCKANQMYLILDLHAAPGGQGNDLNISDRNPAKPSLWQSEANQKKTIALWKKLAERYANEPWIGAYDIINEPNWGFENPEKDKNGTGEQKNEPLRKLMVDVTKAIREVDKRHIIIIEGNGWGNNYNGILPPWDKNMVLSFHKYWNLNDQKSIQHIINFRDKYNIPAWLGETGENSNVWFTEAINLLEKNNIGWSWWPLKKLGFNNPLQIRTNPNYEQVLRYWSGNGNKPGESNAYSGLIELARYTNISTNRVHKDVIDAMIRQPFSADTRPYMANKLNGSLKINAVDYDLGRSGLAYADKDTANYHISTGARSAGNKGNVYRNDGVDIRKSAAAYESYYVSDIEDAEWLQYSVDVADEGTYSIKLRVASDNENAKISVLNGSNYLAKDLVIPKTGAAEKWDFIEMKKVKLGKGTNRLRIAAEKGGFNFSSIELTKTP